MYTLLTKRLRIRPLTAEDAVFIQRLYNTDGFLQYIGDRNLHTPEAARDYIQAGPLAMYDQHGVGLCLVETLSDSTPLGICGLIKRDTLDDIDLGFGFMPESMGKGYALEASRAVLAQARSRHQLRRVVAIATPDNVRSHRLLEKLGFSFDKKIDFNDEVLVQYAISL